LARGERRPHTQSPGNAGILSAPTSRTGVFIFRSTMSNSDASSRHHRNPGNDDADMHSRDALCIRVFLHASKKLASNGQEAISLLPKEGGGAPNGAPQLPRLDAQAQPRPDKRDRSPFGAPPRSCAGIPDSAWAGLPGIAGCKREDPLRHQCSEHLAVRSRAGRADAQTACRLRATNSARRNRTRSVSRRHRLTSLTMNGVDAVIQILNGAVKGLSIYADKSRGCAARLPLCASPDAFHSTLKIRKREVVPFNQGFLCRTNVFGAARRRPHCTAGEDG
jgi:hypothetical protein